MLFDMISISNRPGSSLNVTIIGGGLHGSLTALLLAGDGHRVTILERDPSVAPTQPADAYDEWDRTGVGQFRMIHSFLARFRQELDEHLPDVAAALDAAGALRYNPAVNAPEAISGPIRTDDGRFELLTGRRPVIEAAIQRVVDAHPQVVVHRGVTVLGFELDNDGAVPHVRSVATDEGQFTADLVVDCSGRRSQTPEMLAAAGGIEVREEIEDSGFVYYGRHYRSGDGSIPPMLGGALQHYDSMSTLTLPADNGTWGVGLVTSGRDKAARALRDPDVWERVWGSFPLVAHWADAQPITDVQVMAKLPDRRRDYVVDGTPVVTGLIAVGDAWACTNPSLGRGASIGLMHAVALRDHLRLSDVTNSAGFAVAWQTTTDQRVGPFYEDTLNLDRHRLATIECQINGTRYETDDPRWFFASTLGSVYAADPELFRAYLDVVLLLELGADVAARPGVMDRLAELAPAAESLPGPDRSALEEMLLASV